MPSILPETRYPNGRLKKPRTLEKIAEAERAVAEANMLTVLKQPHRRGNRSQLSENPLGRFCLEHRLDRALYDAADAYGTLRRKWQAQAGAPMIDRLGGTGTGEVTLEDWERWGARIRDWEREMQKAGGKDGLACVVSLIFDRPGPSIKIKPPAAIAALLALAKAMGKK